MKKEIVFIDLDGVLANIEKSFNEYKEKIPEQPYPQSQYGFFMELEPILNSIFSVKRLAEIYDVWFLTAPSFKNLMCYTEKAYWIKKHFGDEWVEKLIICSDKSLLRGDYLVDDHDYGRGQDKFTGELIHFGTKKYKNWMLVSDYLYKPISIFEPNAEFKHRSRIDNAPIFFNGKETWKELNGDKIGIFIS